MQMNKKMLNLPPHLSTSWKNVAALFVEQRGGPPLLKVALTSGKEVEIPNLDPSSIEALFHAHAAFLSEEDCTPHTQIAGKDSLIAFKFPLNMGDQMANFGEMMQHNSAQMHAVPIPQEILMKISEMARGIGMSPEVFPKPEPHCNCPHCQIARAIHQEASPQLESEEEITADDLRFRDWDIEQKNTQLYVVSNPLDKEEHYDVFLGEPIGCTCGQKNCEHMRAVLNS